VKATRGWARSRLHQLCPAGGIGDYAILVRNLRERLELGMDGGGGGADPCIRSGNAESLSPHPDPVARALTPRRQPRPVLCSSTCGGWTCSPRSLPALEECVDHAAPTGVDGSGMGMALLSDDGDCMPNRAHPAVFRLTGCPNPVSGLEVSPKSRRPIA